MKGLQDHGIVAVAKHFPGHGDTDTDSHLTLPVINKTRQQLDSLELYPFRRLIAEGIYGVMIAHLFVPALEGGAIRDIKDIRVIRGNPIANCLLPTAYYLSFSTVTCTA